MKKIWKIVLTILVCLTVLGAAGVLGINAYVKAVGGGRMITGDQAKALENVDCILVLGCQVKADGTPSPMLADRLDTATALYRDGVSERLLMSGDHSREDYNEVAAMKSYAVADGASSEDVYLDHNGFSTYESLYRAKSVFGAERVVIVTQKYHLYRALYIARALGLEAWGVECDTQTYAGQTMRQLREILARNKDFVLSFILPEVPDSGERIPLTVSGDET